MEERHTQDLAAPSIPETPEPAFSTLVEIYRKDEDARAAVDLLRPSHRRLRLPHILRRGI